LTARDAQPERPTLAARVGKAASVAVIAAVAVLAYATDVLRPIDDGLARFRYSLLQRPASHTLTVVEIDVDSLRAAGSWPWGRDRFATVITNLTAAGAEVIALDVDFSTRSSPIADRALEEAIRSRPGTVVLPTFVQAAGKGAMKRQVETHPLETLSDQAIVASVNVPVDADGRVRRYRLGFGDGIEHRASMAATLAGSPPGPTSEFLIDYGIRLSDIDRLSFEAVYAGRFDPSMVRGRKVLIGATALELGDEFATPKRGTLQGVYIHALAYESLHAGRDLKEINPLILLLLAGAAAWALRPRDARDYAATLRRHALVAASALLMPLAIQGWFPVSIDASPVLLAQSLCLLWVVRVELKRRAQAVVDERETHLVQLAEHMRESRDRISAAHDELQVTNAALDKALRARTDFLAMASHEMRTPLNGIMGMTQVVMASPQLPQDLRSKVDLVYECGQAMLALVNDILDVAKIESGELYIAPVEMDLHALLEETRQGWTDKAKTKKLAIRLDPGETPGRIIEDPGRLRQILVNLASNALKFTKSGELSLQARVEPGDSGEILVLQVSDSGIGIQREKFEEIFEAFSQVDAGITRRYGGTGLGLTISRRFARAMGGDLTVESELGQGSQFTLRLPLRRARPEAALVPGSTARCLALTA